MEEKEQQNRIYSLYKNPFNPNNYVKRMNTLIYIVYY